MIELRNVSFVYNSESKNNGLKNINLKIEDGETILICGESGCGKTTLTRLINGLIPNYYEGTLNGKVIVDGIELNKQPLYETAKKVGSVFQNPRTQFYNVDSTSEIVFACENMGLPVKEIQARLDEANEKLELKNLLDRSLFELSGGEKQKIACASAYTAYPKIIVLDEPSSNLDISSIYSLTRVINLWRNQGKTIIIAEHRLYYVVPMVDRIIYMKDGTIEREFTRCQFKSLSIEERKKMGLRSLDSFNTIPERIGEERNSETIQVKDFLFSYSKHGKPELDIPYLKLPQNEIVGIVGHNGAGKSTFARCMCGLDRHARGTITLDKKYDVKGRRKLSYMVMQDVNHQLFTESVLDEVLLSMNIEITEREKNHAIEIIKDLDLYDKLNLHPMSLSGGEKQRVAIGSAIAANKEIIIFDEPTSGLDYRHMDQVSEMLKKLQKSGKSLLIITHDLELIYKCCTYILFIDKGSAAWCRPMGDETKNALRDLLFLEPEQTRIFI